MKMEIAWVTITSANALRDWLNEHHTQQESVWLVTYKKTDQERYVSRDEVLDALLSYGWIDGVRKKLDADKTMQLISPRKAQHWALSYKKRVVLLREKGLMHDAGEAAIRHSKALGLWDFMDDVDRLIIPEDLKKALDVFPVAAHFFTHINPSSKRFVLRWLKLAKTAKTRQARIDKLVALSREEKKLPGS